MFLGTHVNKLDSKGRITLPASFRRAVEGAGGEGYITLSMKNPCLIGFTENHADKLITEVNAPLSQKINYDETGRFVLNQAFRNAVQSMSEIPDTVILVGRKDYFEIWTREDWDAETLNILTQIRSLSNQPTPDQSL